MSGRDAEMTIQPVVTKTGPRQGYLLLDAALPSASRYSARWAIWRGGVLLSIYSKVVVTRLHQDRRPSAEGTDFFRGLRLALTHAILLTAGCLALLILTVMALARAGTVPSIQPHLQQLLTYGPIPTIANCVPRQFHHADCHIAVDGEDIALFVNTETGTITRIVVSGGQYRLRGLPLFFGAPPCLTPPRGVG